MKVWRGQASPKTGRWMSRWSHRLWFTSADWAFTSMLPLSCHLQVPSFIMLHCGTKPLRTGSWEWWDMKYLQLDQTNYYITRNSVLTPGKNIPLLECNQRMYVFQNVWFLHFIYRQFLSKPYFFFFFGMCVCELLCSCASAADLSMLRQRKKIGMSSIT